jgi:dienelactone hydrolase
MMVLIWGDDARVLSLVDALRASGATVRRPAFTPTRGELLMTVREARESSDGAPDDLVIVGFGVGGAAAAGMGVYAKRLGIGLAGAVAVGADFAAAEPISQKPLNQPGENVTALPAEASADEIAAAALAFGVEN